MTGFDLPRDLSTLFIVVSTSSTTAFLQKLISVVKRFFYLTSGKSGNSILNSGLTL